MSTTRSTNKLLEQININYENTNPYLKDITNFIYHESVGNLASMLFSMKNFLDNNSKKVPNSNKLNSIIEILNSTQEITDDVISQIVNIMKLTQDEFNSILKIGKKLKLKKFILYRGNKNSTVTANGSLGFIRKPNVFLNKVSLCNYANDKYIVFGTPKTDYNINIYHFNRKELYEKITALLLGFNNVKEKFFVGLDGFYKDDESINPEMNFPECLGQEIIRIFIQYYLWDLNKEKDASVKEYYIFCYDDVNTEGIKIKEYNVPNLYCLSLYSIKAKDCLSINFGLENNNDNELLIHTNSSSLRRSSTRRTGSARGGGLIKQNRNRKTKIKKNILRKISTKKNTKIKK
jgi:hypothetical protein